MSKPEFDSSIRNIGFILFGGFVLGYLLPLCICSYKNGGVTNLEVLQILQSKNHVEEYPLDTMKINRYSFTFKCNDSLDKEINAIENTITNAVGSRIDLSKYKETICRLDSAKIDIEDFENIKVFGFMETKATLMWPILLSALMIIYFVILPIKTNINWARFFLIFIAVGTVYISPSLLRAFYPKWQNGRIIYSVYNYDVNPAMYAYDLLLNMFAIAMIVLTWLKCDMYVKKNAADHFSDFSLNGIMHTLNAMKRNYNTWQFFSVALFAVFGFLLYILYSYVIDGDKRYLFQAIFFNFVYFFTWIIGSIPLYFDFETWRSFKDKVMFDTATQEKMKANSINVEELRKIIPEYEIASSLNHVITILLSGASFFLPLFKALH